MKTEDDPLRKEFNKLLKRNRLLEIFGITVGLLSILGFLFFMIKAALE